MSLKVHAISKKVGNVKVFCLGEGGWAETYSEIFPINNWFVDCGFNVKNG